MIDATWNDAVGIREHAVDDGGEVMALAAADLEGGVGRST